MLWLVDEHEALTERPWEPSRAEAAVAAIVADAEAAAGVGWPGHPHDDEPESSSPYCLYLGSAGMIWALHELGSSLDAAAMVADAIDRYRGGARLRP